MKIALITDIHEDYHALQLALKEIERRNCDDIFFLGDLLGYNATFGSHPNHRNASACVKSIKDNCTYSVLGNHDLYALRKIPQFRAGIDYPDNWYYLSVQEREYFCEKNKVWFYDASDLPNNLEPDDLNFLDSIPEYQVLCLSGKRLLLSHFIYPDLSGSTQFFPQKQKDFRAHLSFMEEKEVHYSFCGHGHVEGYSLTSKDSFYFSTFGLRKIHHTPSVISLPCLSRGDRKNGFTILQIPEMIMESIAL
jgi:predicted phosphodiesterase